MEALAALKARKPVTSAVTRKFEFRREFLLTPAVPGEKCPTCGCKVPKRQTAAERQRDSRARKKAKV